MCGLIIIALCSSWVNWCWQRWPVGLGLRELSQNIVAGRYISKGWQNRVRLETSASGTIEHIDWLRLRRS